MQLLQKVFFLQRIYFKYTVLEILTTYVLIAIALFFGIGWMDAKVHLPAFTLEVVVAALCYFLARAVVRLLLVNYCYRASASAPLASSSEAIAKSSINNELQGVDILRVEAEDSTSKRFVAVFNFYRHTKYGDYLSKQVYYTVLEVPLIRRLPHVLFDSKVAKHQQFRYMYLQSQRISVQGPFDEVFDTYVPQTYHIDSLSFVSPEVMEALLAASGYDIEILDDKLLLYGPLIGPDSVDTMRAKGLEIAWQLNDNIDTYRDDRLEGQERLKNVTFFGRTLMKSPVKHLVIAGLLAPVVVVILYLTLTVNYQIGYNSLSALVYAFFALNLWRAFKIIHQNKKSMEAFHYLYETDRGRPIK